MRPSEVGNGEPRDQPVREGAIERTWLHAIDDFEGDVDGMWLASSVDCTDTIGRKRFSVQAIRRRSVVRRSARRPACRMSTARCGGIHMQHHLVTVSGCAAIEVTAKRGLGQ